MQFNLLPLNYLTPLFPFMMYIPDLVRGILLKLYHLTSYTKHFPTLLLPPPLSPSPPTTRDESYTELSVYSIQSKFPPPRIREGRGGGRRKKRRGRGRKGERGE